MLILDEPYASPLLCEWAEDSGHPVLATPYAEELSRLGWNLSLVDARTCAASIDAGARIYTNSENALAWILANTSNERLKSAIRLFKDKAAMRKALSPLSPQLFFKSYTRDELENLNPAALPLPVVLKPSVGFCSMGVYTIETPEDWTRALSDIDEGEEAWSARYPESVIDSGEFVVEGYIEGDEYAVDMYYDASGRAHVLNIMRHEFSGPSDTSDRLYNTSAAIVNETAHVLEAWLDEVNAIVGAVDFPAHVEVRMSSSGDIVPIEFNPLRFAGLGGTDLAYHAWGLRTYAAYLEGDEIDLLELASAHPDAVFTMSLLNPDPSADLSRPFQYDTFKARFTNVLGLHEFDVNKVGSYGFLFLETDPSTASELDFLLNTDLLEFLGD